MATAQGIETQAENLKNRINNLQSQKVNYQNHIDKISFQIIELNGGIKTS